MKRLKLTVCLCLLIPTQFSFAQTCNPAIIADAPNSRYTMNANGTVVDKNTALIWMRCALGQTWENNICVGSAQSYYWPDALQAAESTVFAGKNDWRLPNIKELQSLIESRCYNPPINLTAFPNETGDGSYWTSSPVAGTGYGAWVVLFYSEGANRPRSMYYDNLVRLVRSGQ